MHEEGSGQLTHVQLSLPEAVSDLSNGPLPALYGKWVPGGHPARVQARAGVFSLCCFSSTRTAVTSSLLPEGTPTSSPCRALQRIYSALSRGCAAVGEGTHLLLCRDSDHPWNLKSLDFCKPRFPGILCSRCRVSMWWAWTSLVENRCGPGREESLGKALRWPATGWHRTIRLKKAARGLGWQPGTVQPWQLGQCQ